MPNRSSKALPRDLDRFLRDFFPRKRWQSRVQYDHRARRFFLDVIVRDNGLAGDDRFLSLIAFYGRGQRTLLQQNLGLELQCRLFSDEGTDLTPRLRNAESSYLDDGERNSAMGRKLAWLGFRRRLLRDFAPAHAPLGGGDRGARHGLRLLPLDGAAAVRRRARRAGAARLVPVGPVHLTPAPRAAPPRGRMHRVR